VNVFELFASINLDDSQYRRKLQNAQGRLKTFGESAKQTGQRLSTRLTAPLVAIGGGIVAMSTQFDSSMNRVQAVTGATGEEFTALEDLAQELGSTTQFSASQAADGMGFLAQAGFDTKEIMEALPGVLELAAAGQISLGEAADIASNVLGGFDMDPDQIGTVNDVLAETASIANTNVRQLGEAMKMVAPVAAEMDVPIEQVSAAIGALGDVGVQGSEAGTSLRNIFTRLKPAAEELGFAIEDAEGKMLPFPEIIGNINEAGISGDEIMEEFGLRAGPRLLSLLSRGEEGLQDLTSDIEASGGAAQRMAETQMQGLPGAFAEFRSAVEGAAIGMGEAGISDFVIGIVDRVTELVRAFDSLEDDVKRNVGIIAGLLGAAGPVMIAIGVLSTAIGTITAPIAVVVGAVAAFAAAYATDFMGMRTVTDNLVKNVVPMIENLFGTITSLWTDNVKPALEAITPAVEDVEGVVETAFGNMRDFWRNTLKPAWDEIQPEVEALASAVETSFSTVMNIVTGVVTDALPVIQGIIDDIQKAFSKFRREYGDDVIRVTETVVNFATDTVGQLTELFDTLVKRAGDLFNTLRDAWENVLKPSWDEIEPYVEGLGTAFETVLGGSIEAVSGIIDTLIKLLQGDFKGAWDAAKGAVSGAVSIMRGSIEGVKTLVEGFFDLVGNLLERLSNITNFKLPSLPSFGGGSGGDDADTGGGGSGGKVPDWVPDWFPGASDPEDEPASDQFQVPDEIGLDPTFPQMAAGGIVREPTFALVGEAGPEAVVPLDRYDRQNMEAGAFNESVGVFGEFVRRLTQDGIRVQTSGGSRTAALR